MRAPASSCRPAIRRRSACCADLPLRDPQLRDAVGTAGRRRFEERFTQDRMTDGIEEFFVGLVAKVES